jgi:integrase
MGWPDAEDLLAGPRGGAYAGHSPGSRTGALEDGRRRPGQLHAWPEVPRLVLLATFASLRWGEATALTRADLDLRARTVRIKAAYAERSTGELLLGLPKSRAGRRVVGIPAAIIPEPTPHGQRVRVRE